MHSPHATRERLDAISREVNELVDDGNVNARRMACDVAYKLRSVGIALGLPDAETIARDILEPWMRATDLPLPEVL